MDSSVFDSLAYFNPWWARKAVPEALMGRHKRIFFQDLEKNLDNRFIILLHGMRRVGKTTSFFQLIGSLLAKGISPQNILYFSFDEKKAGISEVISAFEEGILGKRILDSGRVFVFFDEIQKADDWEAKIKIIYDMHPNLKIFLSGSATAALRKRSAESLAGRMLDINVSPLSFIEFLEWKGIQASEIPKASLQSEISPLLLDYLKKGGFPEMVFEENDETIRNYVKNAVLEKIIYQDIPGEFMVKDIELLKTLLEIFVKEPGMIINIDRLSSDFSRNKVTVANYIAYLKQSFLVKEIKNLRPSLMLSSRKSKRIYPASTAFCFAMMSDFFTDKNMEKIYETAVAMQPEIEHYYRNSFEIDFIEKDGSDNLTPIEVKHGNDTTNSLKKFMREFKSKKAILITKDKRGENDGITTMTLWRFLMGRK